MKKGQATTFIILGVVIILLLGVGIYYKDAIFDFTGVSELFEAPSEVQEVESMFEECFEELAEVALDEIGLKSGYYSTEGIYGFTLVDEVIPYGLYAGYNTLQGLEFIEKSLEDYLGDYGQTCYYSIANENDIVMTGQLSYDVKINNESVEFKFEYPLQIPFGESVYDLNDDYEFELPVRLGYLYEVANNVVEESIEDATGFDLYYYSSLGANVTVYEMSEEVYLFNIEERDTNYENYLFRFMAYYPYEQQQEDLSEAIEILEEVQ